jgi:aryl-alcohol dehydrogenase-like predicted oxidoreductase
MEYRQLGKSGLKVSAIGLGCGSRTFVGRVDEATAQSIIDHAFDSGVTYFDTAETYAEGRSETLLGKALKGKRSDVVVATKFGKDRSVTEREQRGSRSRVIKAIEGSLRRLSTDYVDLYILHEPDPATPIEETLRALDDLVHSGKVRYVGCSDFRAWQLSEAMWTSRAAGLESFVAAGGEYNLMSREVERDLIPCCLHHGMSFVPTFPLAQGFLTGKYRPGQPMPQGSRFSQPAPFSSPVHQDLRRYGAIMTKAHFDLLARLEAFAGARGHTVAELAIAWLLAQPGVMAIPVGITRLEQLEASLAGVAWKLTADDVKALADVHREVGANTE